jgi:hypothetical protein
MDALSLSVGNYFVMGAGFFFFVYGAVALYRGRIMRDPTIDPTDTKSYKVKVIVGFRARLMAFLIIIWGIP